MGRRSGFESFVRVAVRASAKAARQAEVANRHALAAHLREEKARARERLRMHKEYEKQAKLDYLESRVEEASDLTKESNELFDYLKSGVISETLKIDDTINFEDLKPKFDPPVLALPKKLTTKPKRPELESYLRDAGKMPLLGYILGFIKTRWTNKVNAARAKFSADTSTWQNTCDAQVLEIGKEKKKFEVLEGKYRQEHSEKCSEIDALRSDYLKLEVEAVTAYVAMVLERSSYSFEWNREFKLAYSPESKELLVEFRLPTVDVIPTIAEFKYIKTRDSIDEKIRKKNDIDACYKSLLASIAIRTIHEIQESDQAQAIDIIDFNGFVISIDRSNGKIVEPTVISVSTSKREFAAIDLARVESIRCLQGLSASFSSSPHELTAVKPIREFSMVDKRFIAEQNIMSTLDTRQNLMDLNPFQFEGLVSNLFSKMGLETKQTRSTKDGGVDAVAFDTRPVLGGKIVIQAKRYKNTVGVAAVRDLYGTMINEGASKGILVSTSSYGIDAYEFSKGKPIELIDGGGLLHLLEQVGVDAKIIIVD